MIPGIVAWSGSVLPVSMLGMVSYTGNGASRSYDAGIDLLGDEILLMTHNRTSTSSGESKVRFRDTITGTQFTGSTFSGAVTAPIGTISGYELNAAGNPNTTSETYWAAAFRIEAPKLMISQYSGDGTSSRAINHGLGVLPGMFFIKVHASGYAALWHRNLSGGSYYLKLSSSDSETDDAEANSTSFFASAPDASNVYIGNNALVNSASFDYTLYAFGHDSSPNSSIFCGSYTGNGDVDGPEVSCVFTPRILIVKRIDSPAFFYITDSELSGDYSGSEIYRPMASASASSPEASGDRISGISGGFKLATTDPAWNASGGSYVFVAMR